MDQLKGASPESFPCLCALSEGTCSQPHRLPVSCSSSTSEHLGMSLAAEPGLAQLAVLAENLVWQLVINSPCIHRLGRVLLAWVQGTLEKRQLSLPSSACQAQSWCEGAQEQAPRAWGPCRPTVRTRAGCRFEALLYRVAWDGVGRVAIVGPMMPFGVGG